jgi:hypothetical protein
MKNIQPANKRSSKTYNRPSMKPAPALSPPQHQRDWGASGHVSYGTRVQEVFLEDKHKAQRKAGL